MKTYRNMKPFSVFVWTCKAITVILIAGCHVPLTPIPSDEEAPVERIRISAITEFVPDGKQIKTLVELFDASDLSLKAPCVFRFELYEFSPVSSDPRGRRLTIWPDQDLNDPDINNKHWKEFLKGYEFVLPLDFFPEPQNKYILEASCLVDQNRYNDLFKIHYQP